MANIFPFVELAEEQDETPEDLPMAVEYAWDFELEDFKRKSGRIYKVEGIEAIKIWLWKLFKVPRYRYLIYTWDYGNELESLLGRGYSQNYINAEAKGYVREAIEYNLGEYVTNIIDLSVNFADGKLSVETTIETPYGEVIFNG